MSPLPRQNDFDQQRFDSHQQVVLLLVLIVCHLPMLLSYFYTLARYDHYQFFPLALLATGWLAWTRIDFQNFRWTKFGRVCIAIDLVLLAGSCLLMSPWLAAVGTVFLMIGLSWSSIEKPNRRPFEIALLFLTVVRPPFGADIELIQRLQLLTSRYASGLMDRLGVLHVQTGNLISLSDRQLFVEDTCSGVQSLFTLLFLSAAIVAWHRRPPLHAFFLMLMAPICSIPMNILRVVAVAVGWDSLKLDLTSGLAHDVVGYVLLAFATAFLICGDRSIAFLSAPISDEWEIQNGRSWSNPFVRWWNRIWTNLRRPRISEQSCVRGHLLKIAIVTCIVLTGFQCFSLFAAYKTTPLTPVEPKLAMPATLGNFEYQSEDWTTRSSSNSFGKYSGSWTYQGSGLRCVFSCDYPFPAWHALEVCYEGQGWTIGEKFVSDGEWPMTSFRLTKPTGENAYLVYSFFESDGTIVRPPSITDPTASFHDRIMKPGNWLVGERVLYQSQLFVRSNGELPETDSKQLSEHHRKTRELMRKGVGVQETTP